MLLLPRGSHPGCDAELLAETLLAALAAELFIYLREAREMPLARIKEGWREMVDRVVSGQPVAIG